MARTKKDSGDLISPIEPALQRAARNQYRGSSTGNRTIRPNNTWNPVDIVRNMQASQVAAGRGSQMAANDARNDGATLSAQQYADRAKWIAAQKAKDIEAWNAAEAAKNNPPVGDGSFGGGGFGGGGALAPVEPEVDPLTQMLTDARAAYDKQVADERARLANQAATLRGQTLPLYDTAAGSIRDIYARTSADLRQSYDEGLNPLKAGAESLGFGDYWGSDANVRMFDAAARKLQETSDLNLANDLSWTDKMKAHRGDLFDQQTSHIGMGLYDPEKPETLLALEQAAMEAALANALGEGTVSGGGGKGYSGGRRGGRSSSGEEFPWQEKAETKEEFFNPGLVDAISAIGDENTRAYIDSIYARTGTNPRSALSESQEAYDAAQALRPTVRRSNAWGVGSALSAVNRGQRSEIDENRRLAQAAVNFYKNWSAGYRPQQTRNTVTTSATNKYD